MLLRKVQLIETSNFNIIDLTQIIIQEKTLVIEIE